MPKEFGSRAVCGWISYQWFKRIRRSATPGHPAPAVRIGDQYRKLCEIHDTLAVLRSHARLTSKIPRKRGGRPIEQLDQGVSMTTPSAPHVNRAGCARNSSQPPRGQEPPPAGLKIMRVPTSAASASVSALKCSPKPRSTTATVTRVSRIFLAGARTPFSSWTCAGAMWMPHLEVSTRKRVEAVTWL